MKWRNVRSGLKVLDDHHVTRSLPAGLWLLVWCKTSVNRNLCGQPVFGGVTSGPNMCNILFNFTWCFLWFPAIVFLFSRTTALTRTQPCRQLWRCRWLRTDSSLFSQQPRPEGLMSLRCSDGFVQPTNKADPEGFTSSATCLSCQECFFFFFRGSSVASSAVLCSRSRTEETSTLQLHLVIWDHKSSWTPSQRAKPSTAAFHTAPIIWISTAWRATSIQRSPICEEEAWISSSGLWPPTPLLQSLSETLLVFRVIWSEQEGCFFFFLLHSSTVAHASLGGWNSPQTWDPELLTCGRWFSTQQAEHGSFHH